MRELNLRPDYPEWDWNSTTNRQQAYQAMVEKLGTTNFKQTVWNELVTCLYNALSELGLPWNSTYASYSATKMVTSINPVVFTATMFNSVAKNIEAVINSTWKWQYDGTYEGYVGRSNYVGASSSNNPDTLYGSAILELARKLNVFLQVMKNGDIVLDGEIDEVFHSLSDTILAAPEAKRMYSNLTEVPIISADLKNIEAKELNSRTTNRTSQDARPELIVASESMRVNATSRATLEATIILELLYKNLSAYIIHTMRIQARMTVDYDSVNIRVDIPASLVENALLSHADVIDMISASNSAFGHSVDLSSIESIILAIERLYHSYSVADLRNNIPKTIHVTDMENCVCDVSMESVQNFSFVAFVIHRSYASSTVIRRTAGTMAARLTNEAVFTIPTIVSELALIMQIDTLACITEIESAVNTGAADYLDSESANTAVILSDGIVQEAIPLLQNTILHSVPAVNLDKCLMRWLTVHYSCQGIISSALAKGTSLLASVDATERMTYNTRLELYIVGETLNARCVYSQGNTATLDALNYGDNYLKSNTEIHERFEVLLDNGEPFVLAVNEIFHSSNVSTPDLLDAENTMKINAEAFRFTEEASIGVVNLIYPIASTESNGTISALITFDPSSWYNPVLEDGVLTVLQVFGATKIGSNLNLE